MDTNSPQFQESFSQMMNDPNMMKNVMEIMQDPEKMKNIMNLMKDIGIDNSDSMDNNDNSSVEEITENRWDELTFNENDKIKIHGLKNDIYNGKIGIIKEYDNITERYTIFIEELNKSIAIMEDKCILLNNDNDIKTPEENIIEE